MYTIYSWTLKVAIHQAICCTPECCLVYGHLKASVLLSKCKHREFATSSLLVNSNVTSRSVVV